MIPTPIPTPESESESSFDSDYGVGIAPGLVSVNSLGTLLAFKFSQAPGITMRTALLHVNNRSTPLGAIQVLRNADGGGGVSDFLGKSVTKV